MFLMISGNSSAQILNESFTGVAFPPPGWTAVNVAGAGGFWVRSTVSPRTVPACAFSNFLNAGAENWLITKRIVPAPGDSLVFWFRHTFASLVVNDTFDVKISTTDSLLGSFTTTIRHMVWPTDYGTAGVYMRLANLLPAGTRYIAFRHIDIDGDAIRLDDIIVGAPPPNQIVLSDAVPLDSNNTEDTYAPRATVTNTGTNNQFNFNVTYTITGPVPTNTLNYSSTRTIDTLLAGQSRTIVFDSTFTPVDSGRYNASISSTGAGALTVIFNFRIITKNWGIAAGCGCCYRWANSQARSPFNGPPFPTRPTFSWRDPANIGSPPALDKKVLTSAGVNNFPGIFVGSSLDDGHWNNMLPAGKRVKLCGICYDSIKVGTNGIIGFNGSNSSGSNLNGFSFTNVANPFPAVNPLWMDFDFRTAGIPAGSNITYVVGPGGKELVVTWTRAKRFLGDSTDFVSFQACIELVDSNCSAPNSNIRFSYNRDRTGPNFLQLGTTGSIGAGNTNTVSNQLVGLVPSRDPCAIYYRKRNGPLAGKQGGSNGRKTGPLFAGANDNTTSLAVEFGQCFRPLNLCDTRILCVRFYLEGWRLSGSTLLDTVKISVRSAVSPHPIIESATGVFNAAGFVYVPVSTLTTGVNYYLTVEHRNTIRTWSNLVPGPAGNDSLKYDFTTAVSKAFGSNQTVVNGAAAFYSGDVNQDGVVDVTDAALVDNDIFNFVSGYVPTDVNGDLITDISDAAIVDNNAFNFVSEVAPPGPIADDKVYINLPVSNDNKTFNTTSDDGGYSIWKENYLRNEELRETSPVKIR